MADEILRRNLDRAFDPGAGFPDRLLLSRTMAMLDVPSTTEQRFRWRQPQALALIAAVLTIAIVATLMFAARQHQTAPASPGPHRAAPYTIPTPPSAASSCSSVPRQWASSPPNPAKMLSATTGWAYGPMRTTDGGAHWLDVSPPSIPGRTNKNDEFFLDATHAWVAETAGSPTSCVDHVVIFRTADGGQTWQQSAPIPVRFSVPTDVIWTGTVNHASWFDFIDAENGWLLLGSGPKNPTDADATWTGATWRVGDLYRTIDGGLHWTLVATNPGSATGCVPSEPKGGLHHAVMSFSSATTGWILLDCGQVMVTHDAGLTWAIQVLPSTPIEVPDFFDARHGMVLGPEMLFVTSDGGASWNVRALPAGAFGTDFINPNEGWAFGIDIAFQCSQDNLVPCNHNFRLHHTNDGGKTWVPGNSTSLGMPNPKALPPAYLHFVDSKHGFVSTGEDPPENGLFRTTDAGLTWTRFDGTIERP